MSWLVRALSLGFAGGAAYSLYEPHRVAVRRVEVTLAGLPSEVEGLRIAQLSDLHCSAITSSAIVRQAVRLCNAEVPDVVVMTGDYISRRNSYSHFTFARQWARDSMEYAARMADEVRALSAPDGVFAVPGNHDHAQGSCDAVAQLLESVGVQLLVNRSATLRGVLPLIGLDDLREGRPNVRAATQGVAADVAQVVITHNPRLFPRVAERNALVIAGHTHGGQVHLPLTGFRRRPRDMRFAPWQQGWYRGPQAQLYVSVGVGSVHFPMRFDCQPEIVVYTLRRR